MSCDLEESQESHYFYLCVLWVYCMSLLHHICMHVCRGQKRVPHPPVLELHVVMNCVIQDRSKVEGDFQTLSWGDEESRDTIELKDSLGKTRNELMFFRSAICQKPGWSIRIPLLAARLSRAFISSSKGPDALFWSLWASVLTCTIFTHVRVHTYTHACTQVI